MKRKSMILVLAILTAVLLAGCGCKHEWVAATCMEAKHCGLCGKTEGKPADHIPGNWGQGETDYDSMTVASQRKCAVCGAVLEEKTEPLTKPHKNGKFIVSPDELVERMRSLAETNNLDFSFEYVVPYGIRGTYEVTYAGEPCATMYFFWYDNDIAFEETAFGSVSYNLVRVTADIFLFENESQERFEGYLALCTLTSLACDPSRTTYEEGRQFVENMKSPYGAPVYGHGLKYLLEANHSRPTMFTTTIDNY